MSLKSIILKGYFSRREAAIDYFRRHPAEVQERMLRYLLRRGQNTEFGWRYNLKGIRTPEQARAMLAAGADRIGAGNGVILLDNTGDV